MATLLDIKTSAASYLDRELADFTINGQDLWLIAANQVRKQAELDHDFEFNRKFVSVSVNGTTGGDLGSALDINSNPVIVKTVIEVGMLDQQQNLIPVEWTTVAESLERQRQGNRFAVPRYPDDNWTRDTPYGLSRFNFAGDSIFRWPKTSDSESLNFPLWMEVYSFDRDWTSADLQTHNALVTGTLSPDATGTYQFIGLDNGPANFYVRIGDAPYRLFWDTDSWYILQLGSNTDAGWTMLSMNKLDPSGTYTAVGGSGSTGTATVVATSAFSGIWTTYGQQYLLWATIVQLNKLFKVFVPRQEGNLPPPTDQADAGLQSLIDWDNYKFEQFRRHNR